MNNETELAIQLYEVYGDSAQWTNFQGNPMPPTWEQLPENIQTHWTAVANYVLDEYSLNGYFDIFE
ncbi:hypothetical protein [Scytonema sp. NUACC26]|uniref:hypothetical protein n=1 Tax=Scytonema sp. NUACC26 TaxID=3140176 RepID=UPI0038B298FA